MMYLLYLTFSQFLVSMGAIKSFNFNFSFGLQKSFSSALTFQIINKKNWSCFQADLVKINKACFFDPTTNQNGFKIEKIDFY